MTTVFCYYCAPRSERREIDPSEICPSCLSRIVREDRIRYLLARYRRLQDHGIATEADRADYSEAMIVADAMRAMIVEGKLTSTEAATLVGYIMLRQTQAMVAGSVGRDEDTVRRACHSGIRKLAVRIYGVNA